MSIAILPLAIWPEGINQASIPANDNAWRMEVLSGLIISKAVTAQPGSPVAGDIYIIAATHTGAQWSTFDEDDLTIYKGGTWHAFAPIDGVVVNFAGHQEQFSGSSGWVAVAGGGGGGSIAGADKQIQYNNAGAFGAEAGLEYDQATNTLSAPKAVLSAALNEAKGSDIASAGTTDIGAAIGNLVHVTGTTTITALGTVQAGTRRIVVFDGALTLTHNATSLILPTGANITTAAGDTAVCVSEGAGNWRVTSYQRKDGSALVVGGASLANWTEAVSTAAPNATVPVVSFTATNAATNVDAALVAKGTGAIVAQVADSTSAGGNKRGIYSVDWQRSRTAAANVASQQYSVIGGGTDNKTIGSTATIAGGNANVASNTYAAIGGGSTNTASGDSSAIPGGASNTASGQYSFAAGSSNNVSGTSAGSLGASNIVSGNHSFGFGQSNTVNAQYSFVHGNQGSARALVGARVHSVSSHNQAGDLQSLGMVLRCSTSNATPAVMTTTNAAASTTNQMVLQNNQSATVAGKVVARDSSGSTASWTFAASIKRGANAAATAMVAACTPVQVAADAGASTWALSVTADTTNGALAVTFTGAAATNIRAGCVIEDIECTF